MIRGIVDLALAGLLLYLSTLPPHFWIDTVLHVEAGALIMLGILRIAEARR